MRSIFTLAAALRFSFQFRCSHSQDGPVRNHLGCFAASVDLLALAGKLSLRRDQRQRERERIARELHDTLLQGFLGVSLQLQAAVEQVFSCLRDEFAAGGGVRFRVLVTGQPKALKPAIQEQIYLIGREALINAFRHSEATSIEAEVEYLPRRLRILVRDNGHGIDPKTVQSGRHAHWGLLGMRERAAGIGAQLRIWSRPGCGTEVEISISGRTLAEACL